MIKSFEILRIKKIYRLHFLRESDNYKFLIFTHTHTVSKTMWIFLIVYFSIYYPKKSCMVINIFFFSWVYLIRGDEDIELRPRPLVIGRPERPASESRPPDTRRPPLAC